MVLKGCLNNGFMKTSMKIHDLAPQIIRNTFNATYQIQSSRHHAKVQPCHMICLV
jgi:hypothetical protein